MNNTSKNAGKLNVHRMTLLAIFTSIILVMSFTPLGYLPIPGFQITLLMIPVSIGAIITDWKGGLFLGTVFGLSSFLVGILNGWILPIIELSPLLNSILVFIWLVVPRMLMGLLVNLIFTALSKIDKTRTISYFVSGLSGAILNTLLYLLFLILLFGANKDVLAIFGAETLLAVIVGILTLNAAIEAVVSLVAVGAIGKALSIYFPQKSPVSNNNKINKSEDDL